MNEIKSLAEQGNRTIAAIQTEQKADREKMGRMEAELAATLKAKQDAELKLTALENRLTEIETKAGEIQFGSDATKQVEEHKSALIEYARTGSHESIARLNELSKKATDARTLIQASGGFAVPTVVARDIEKLVLEYSPFRSLASVINIGTQDYSEVVDLNGATGEWVAEGATRNQTNTPDLAQFKPTGGALAAKPQATVDMIEDAWFDVEAWLTDAVAECFGQMEGAAFVSGNGTNKPTGFLNGTPVATGDASRAFGVLQYVPTGVAAALSDGTHDIYDTLLDLTVSMKGGYRSGAQFTMNSLTNAQLAKIKDEQGRPLLQPNLQAGTAQAIHGFGITLLEDMPIVGANAFPIAFGNFKRGYKIADRLGMTLIRDEITAPGFVKFIARKRVFGGVKNSEAIKLLKVAAS